ncbi:RNA pyrophosphohydrolase [Aquisalimonas lutea]|uniref:RNA pyrophosphohydrolase n=1 Tax=Aquisalimonas lutea TaxID=1327750 RepID=UPI0025B4E55B|nr:RNA pyrophosphohydrolase [Aquisalimonas lutea]MDN3517009.1 RNA pyrophosphohydrolase [Aquisalimonas lutea]
MIDSDGFRANVGIILCNDDGRVFWGRRIGQNAWQFPQGGIEGHETAEEALYRELYEEVGLAPEHVQVVGATAGWLRYHLPRHLVRRHQRPVCIGQKQQWFLLRLTGGESAVRLDASGSPEFDDWRWVDYWRPARDVVFFKRHVYRRALRELAPLLFPDGAPARRAPGRNGPDRRRRSSGG